MSSVGGRWCRRIRAQVQPYTPCSGGADWHLPVILTLRTWAVWNRNKKLSIGALIKVVYLDGKSLGSGL